jgi:hypothetical protein
MPGAITIAVFALAVARVTRLITKDRITEAPRNKIVLALWARAIDDEVAAKRFPNAPIHRRRWIAQERFEAGAEAPLLAYLLTCPWCASIYVAAVAAPVCWAWGDSPYAFVPAIGLAFSQITGLLAKIGD